MLLAAPVHGAEDKIDLLSQTLRIDSSYKVRAQAALILGKLGEPRGVRPLIDALKDENDAVRGAAASSLGKLRDLRAVMPLTALRNDNSDFVREAANKALAVLEQVRMEHLSQVSQGKARFYFTVNIADSSTSNDARTLRELVTAEIAKIPGVTLILHQGEALTSWAIEANITALKIDDGHLMCDVSVAISTLPGRSIKAMASAGATVSGMRPDDAAARRDCLASTAEQIAEQVGKFLRTQ